MTSDSWPGTFPFLAFVHTYYQAGIVGLKDCGLIILSRISYDLRHSENVSLRE